MGTWTLADFRNELTETLGNRGIDEDRLDRWINIGKREVEAGVDLETTRVCRFFTMEIGQKRYTLVDRFLSIVSIVDSTSGNVLIRSDVESWDVRQNRSAGKPEFWARRGRELLFDPAPDKEYEIAATLILETVDLVEPEDTTIHPAYWDPAINMAATHHAYAALGEEHRAEIWFGRFLRYMQSRMLDSDFEGQSVSEPVRVARDLSDLKRR